MKSKHSDEKIMREFGHMEPSLASPLVKNMAHEIAVLRQGRDDVKKLLQECETCLDSFYDPSEDSRDNPTMQKTGKTINKIRDLK
jgi:hypothetical protein